METQSTKTKENKSPKLKPWELSPAEERKIQKEIDKRNKIFKKASPAQKRVLIAKDVIDQIRLNKIKPQNGVFFRSNYIDKIDEQVYGYDERDSISMQKTLLSDKAGKCRCCALGSLVTSCTLYNNKSTLADLQHDFLNLGDTIRYGEKISNGLNEIFDKEQLKLIEIAFEKGVGYFCGYMEYEAISFGQRFRSAEKRLIAIMQNIIENEGEFIP